MVSHHPTHTHLTLTDRWATRCYCLIISVSGNTQKFSVSADKGTACLLCTKTRRRQWLEAGQVFWPSRSLHIIDFAFVLCGLIPVAQHVTVYKEQTTYKQSARPGSIWDSRPRCQSSAGCLDLALISVSAFTLGANLHLGPPGLECPTHFPAVTATQWNWREVIEWRPNTALFFFAPNLDGTVLL